MKKIITFFHVQGGCGGSTTNAKNLYAELSKDEALKVIFLNCSTTPLEDVAVGKWFKDVEELKTVLGNDTFNIAIIDLPAPDGKTDELIQYAIGASDLTINNIHTSNRCFLRCHKEVVARWIKEMNKFIDNEKCIGTIVEPSMEVPTDIHNPISSDDMILTLKRTVYKHSVTEKA